jgi:hypothetical protein
MSASKATVAITKYISLFANPANNKVVISNPNMSHLSQGQIFTVPALVKMCVAEPYLLKELSLVPATQANITKHYPALVKMQNYLAKQKAQFLQTV